MAAPTAVLLARLAGLLESARLEAGTYGMDSYTMACIKKAQDLLDIIRDGV